MDALRLAVGAIALTGTAPAAHADSVDRWTVLIGEASVRFGVPAEWIARVMRAESGGMTVWRGRPITSRAGAMGLMQLMPATWADMRARLGLGENPHDPRDNILAGTFYLRLMYERFGYPGLFGAYSAGPGRYAAYRAGASRLPGETVAYLTNTSGISAAIPAATGYRAVAVSPQAVRPPDRLFFALAGQAEALRPAELFMPLRQQETSDHGE